MRTWTWMLTVLLLSSACKSSTANSPADGQNAADSVSSADAQGDAGSDAGGSDAISGSGQDGQGSIAAANCLAATDPSAICDTNANCATGQFCDPCKRVCATAHKLCEPCVADNQCEQALVEGQPGSACLTYQKGGSFCGLVCLSDGGCPAGYSCQNVIGIGQMQCVPKSSSCGTAAGGCSSDADCPYLMVCNKDYATCTAGCADSTMCSSGKVCSAGHCSDPCAADADCASVGSGAKCQDKICKIPGGCLTSSDCVTPQTHCDGSSHKCAPGCVEDADCKDVSQNCQGGLCKKTGCTKNWQCGYSQVCDVGSGQCKAATGNYCAPCDTKDDKATACGGSPNACFQMQDSSGADKGAFCGIICGSDPGGPCPQGYACQDIKDDKGQSQGKFCLRSCYSKPVGVSP